ncbi:hypothetical protein B0H14DRAFT_3870283 [Mycena olivaceomarginata]|nr:hypothetical protein B0H14DRAFT_3870283 [Mycena olivaceomarginata]
MTIYEALFDALVPDALWITDSNVKASSPLNLQVRRLTREFAAEPEASWHGKSLNRTKTKTESLPIRFTQLAETHWPSVVADLERLENEIVHLKGLVDAFSSRRGRGRKKRARDDDDESEDPDPKRSKAAPGADYFAYGQTIGRFLGCHVALSEVVAYGCHTDTALSGDEGETDQRLEDAWKILCQKFPGFHQYMLELTKDPTTRRAIVKQMTLGMDLSCRWRYRRSAHCSCWAF